MSETIANVITAQKGQAIAVGVNDKQRIEIALFNADAEELVYIDLSAAAAKGVAYDLIDSLFKILSSDNKKIFVNYLASIVKENR